VRHPSDEAIQYLCEKSEDRRAFRDEYALPALVDSWRNYVVREDRFNRYAEMTSHGPSHAENVAALVTDLALPFSRAGAGVAPFLTDTELVVLLAAAYLHDVGMYTTFDHYYAEPLKIRELHGRLSRQTLMREGPFILPTLSPAERHLVALLCSYHQGSAPLSEVERLKRLEEQRESAPPHPPEPDAPHFPDQASLEHEVRDAQAAGINCFGLEHASPAVCPFLLATLLKLLDGCDYQANRNGSIEAVFRHADRNLSHAARSERLLADCQPGTPSARRADVERGFFEGSLFHFIRNLLIERTLILAQPAERRISVLIKPADPDEILDMCRLLVRPSDLPVAPGDDTLERFERIMALVADYQRAPLQTAAEWLKLDPGHKNLREWHVDQAAGDGDRRTVHYLVARRYIERELDAVRPALKAPPAGGEYLYCAVCVNRPTCRLRDRPIPAFALPDGAWDVRMFGGEAGRVDLQRVPSLRAMGRLPSLPEQRGRRTEHPRTQDAERLAAAVDRHKQLLIYGPVGRGKTLLARAAALASVPDESHVLWHTVADGNEQSAALVRSLADFLALRGDFSLSALIRDERVTTRHEAAALRLLHRGSLAGTDGGLVAVIDEFNRLTTAARPFFKQVLHLFPCLTCAEGPTCRPDADRPWHCRSATSRVLLISTKVPGLSYEHPRVGGLPVKALAAPAVSRADAERIVRGAARGRDETTLRRAVRVWADHGGEACAIPMVESCLAARWESRHALRLIAEELADTFAGGFNARTLGETAGPELLSLIGLLDGVLSRDEVRGVLGLRAPAPDDPQPNLTDESPLQRLIDRGLVRERRGRLSAHPAWVAGRRRTRWVDRVSEDPWAALVRYPACGLQPGAGLRRRWTAVGRYLPELAALRRLPGGRHHTADVLEHSLRVLEGVPDALGRLREGSGAESAGLIAHLDQQLPGRGSWPALSRLQLLRIAALFHDIGKARTRGGEAEAPTYHEHERVGAEMWAESAGRRGVPSRQVAHIERLISLHLRPLALFGAMPASAKALRSLVTDAGDELIDLLVLFWADLFADPREPSDPAAARAFVDEVLAAAAALRAAAAASGEAPSITGDDLRAAGLAPSPAFGAALKAAQAAARSDPSLGRDELLRRAEDAYVRAGGGEAPPSGGPAGRADPSGGG